MMRQNCPQSIGLWLNEPLLHQPELVDGSIEQLADAGFGIIRLFLRNSNHAHGSSEVVALVRRSVERAHACGLKVALDCEPHDLVGRELVRRFPDAMGTKLVYSTARVVDGHWTLRVEPPGASSGVACWLEGIEASFLSADGAIRPVELQHTMSRGTQWYRNGHIHRELFYRENVANAGLHRQYTFVGHLDGVRDGHVIAYLRFAARNFVDFWADGFQSYFNDLLEQYRDIPLDGVCWDEPAADADWGSYRYGAAFVSAFERQNGYRLRDRLFLLDAPGMSAESVKVRLDYYRTLNEGIAQSQSNMIGKARELFGENLLLGTHHTWQGEGGSGDYRAGAVDYFRLNDNMDAGYTDCSWWDQDAVAYAYTLASSLGRQTPSGQCEVNTWHYAPTVSNVRTNVNRMTLMNVTWFNIWAGRDCDCVMQEGHYTWPETVAAMRRHQSYQQEIGARKPVVDVAIWHGWEGVCAWNRLGLANAHKAFCLNTSRMLLERSIAADFIDSRLLAHSRVDSGRLVNSLGSYRILIIPYALAIPRAAFKACVSFARAGGRVLFVGTPVAADEHGNSLCEDFAALFSMPTMTAEHYMAGLDAVCTLPSGRPQRLEVCRQVGQGIPEPLISKEGERHGVVGQHGNAVFLTDLDPQERLIEWILPELKGDVRVHGDNVLWRRYSGADGELLVVVAREDRPLSGIIRLANMSIELNGGSVGLFRIGTSVTCVGDAVWKQL